VTRIFPTADALAEIDPSTLSMPATRARALVGLSTAVARGEIEIGAGSDRDATQRALLALLGIGPWTVAYVAMRALRDPDAFLASDLGVRHALERLGHDGSPASAIRLADAWRPYRAYALQHLWSSLDGPALSRSPSVRETVAALAPGASVAGVSGGT
jgi:AraC family transcriptional regulator, regulatory protein of adaptative response / DNA-3-methyladenine glycosylase II